MENHQDLDCYKVLALQSPKSSVPTVTQEEIKEAYRRALLANHPDKVHGLGVPRVKRMWYTIDEITYAYKTLSNPVHRLQHDRNLKFQSSGKEDKDYGTCHIGIDTLDLDELYYDCAKREWRRSCRCGDRKGFMVDEDMLQESSENGELIAECPGCSLRLRVTFAVADDG
ncbi:MAG: hypothetical protein LQ338_002910 [Usnochroma carphineum]|nr:MAG: hypothetical protein LQ338_002910 [Usnochroma carphineum]